MKKELLSAALIAASLNLVSCTSELPETFSQQPETVRISIESSKPSIESGDPSSKTYIEENENKYLVHWAESGDELGILYRYVIEDMNSTPRVVKTSGYTLDADGRAKHSVDISIVSGASDYCLAASYPYADSYSSYTGKMTFTLPENQTPAADSYDPAADCLISVEPKTSASVPEKVTFSFHRPVAIVKMTLLGIGAGEKISTIEFTAAENVAGNFTADLLTTGLAERVSYTDGEYHYKTITLDMQGREATGSDAVWFTALPADLTGQTISVKVVTDKNTYSKDADLSVLPEFLFEAATVTKFIVGGLTVEEAPAGYSLLTDASTLRAGDKMLVCNSKVIEQGYGQYLLGTAVSTDASNIGIAKSDEITVSSLSGTPFIAGPLPANARVFTLETADGGAWYLKADDGYLYAEYNEADYAATLAVKPERVDSWALSVESAGNAAIKSLSTERYISYNSWYDPPFTHASSPSSNIFAYVLPGDGSTEEPVAEPLATPVISAVTVEGSSVTVSWAAVDGAASYDVNFADGYSVSGVSGTSHTFEGVPDGTYPAAGISVVANPEPGDEMHTVSEAGTWNEDVVVSTSTGPSGVTLSFNLIDYKTSSSVGDITDADNLVTISFTGGSTGCSWRTVSSHGFDGIFCSRNLSLKIALNDSSKKITGIVLYAPKDGDSYKTISISGCEADWVNSAGTYDSANGQYLWSGKAGSYVKFTTGGSSFVSRIDVTLE